ncbi:GNAT family N-acetyltransferase [Streptomyces sp. NPDC006879]|uniref:GNAT family N-acetyltransferase n=1 Tax=Streptomyces sp. NPDC006879 TaxID=3364767 RepID=UPI00368708AA
MHILSHPEAEVPTSLRAQVLALQDEAWPPVGAPSAGPSHDPALRPRSLLLVEGPGTVVAALDVLHKPLLHAGSTYRAAGLSTVVTRRDRRGQGHGHHLVNAARERLAAEADVDLVLFTCDRPLVAFYRGAGFGALPGAVLVGGTPDAPFPSDRPGLSKAVMVAFHSPRARARRADFEGARILLHPGTIDRLW